MSKLSARIAAIALLACWLPLAAAPVLRFAAADKEVTVASPRVEAPTTGNPDMIAPNLFLLAVSVTDPKGRAVAGADVALDDGPLGFTDESGQYYLARKPMAPGPHTLSVSHAGFAKFSGPVTLPNGDAPGISLPVRLERQSTNLAAKSVERGEHAERAPNYHVVQIFYVTDRQDTGSADPILRYANQRASSGSVSKGTCDISIPRTHESGSLESPSWVRLEYRPDPNKHVVLLNVKDLAPDPFYRRLSERVAKSKEKEIVVFIHGFNNSFEEAARKTAQLTWDLQFDGAPILYSWPSRNKLLAYTQDEDTVQWTAFHLRAFLEELAERTDAKKIHLIAHSMGNRALTSALQIIAAKRQGMTQPLYDQVVLAAPDIGADTMDLLAREVRPVARQMTLYASARDDALILSKFVHGGLRAGGKDTFLLIAPGIDTVDASAARTDFVGHAYFDNSVTIITDIKQMIATAAAPEARLLIPGFLRDLKYWTFPAATAPEVQIH